MIIILVALAIFFLVNLISSSATDSNKKPWCKRHTWQRIELDGEISYLKCSVCNLVANPNGESSYEEKERP